MTFTDDMRAVLESRLVELKARQSHLAADLDRPLDPDAGERAVEVEDDAALDAQIGLVSQEIHSIERALHRMDQGTFGACATCGEAISNSRLSARPEAALCLACANQRH